MSIRPLAAARQTLAIGVTICLAFGPGFAAPAAAPSPELGHGSIHGTLYMSDEKTTLAGAKVRAINVRTGTEYSSEVTLRNGGYLIDGVPAGTYQLIVEVGDNLFVVDNVIDLSRNESAAHSFAVQPQKPASGSDNRTPSGKGKATPVGEASIPARVFWKTPGGIVLLSVLGAGAVAVIINSIGHDQSGSPSAP